MDHRTAADRNGTSLTGQVAVGALWAAVATWGKQILQLAVFVLLARWLGPETFGTFALVLALVATGQLLVADGGWHEVLVARRDPSPESLDTIFWTVLGLGGGLALFLAAAAPLAAAWFALPDVAFVLPVAAMTLPLSALAIVPEALLYRDLRLAPVALTAWLSLLGAGALGAGLALAGAGIWALVAYHLAEAGIRAVALAASARWMPRPCFSFHRLREMLRFTAAVLGDNLLLLVANLAPRYAIALLLGAGPLAFFSVARKVVDLVEEAILAPLGHVLLPAFAELRARARAPAAAAERVLRLAFVLSAPVAVGLVLAAPLLVELGLGPGWSATAPVLQLLAVLVVLGPLPAVARTLLYTLGRAATALAMTAASVAVLLVLLALARPFGLIGVAAAVVVQAVVLTPLAVLCLARYAKVEPLLVLRAAVPAALCTLAMAVPPLAGTWLLGLSLETPATAAALLALGLAAYAACALTAIPTLRIELAVLARALRPGVRSAP